MDRRAPPLDLLILDELARRSPQTLASLRHAINGSTQLLPEDLERHQTRINEPKWHSDLSNRLQPTRAGSLSRQGYTESAGRGQYAITAKGETYRQREHVEIKMIEDLISAHNIDFSE